MHTCAYNIDDLYHTGRIDPPGMEKVVYIVCAYYIIRTPDIPYSLMFSKIKYFAVRLNSAQKQIFTDKFFVVERELC